MAAVPAGRRALAARLRAEIIDRATHNTGRWWGVALDVTEFALRVATKIGGGANAYIVLGQVREARGRPRAASEAYTLAAGRSGDAPAERRQRAHAHYRLARLAVSQRDWAAAESSFALAVSLRPELATWHGHRGQALEARGEWAAAVACFREALRIEPDVTEWIVGLLRVSTAAGKPAAVDEAAAALRRRPEDARLARALAKTHQAMGDWWRACAVLRGLLEHRPADVGAREQLAACLEQAWRVPFYLDREGQVIPSSGADQDAALAAALEAHRRLIRDQPWRPGHAHKLGLLAERAGLWREAADAYELAISRLSTVDSWWCHRAAHDWAFRHAYVRHRLAGATTPEDPKLGRSVASADSAAVTDAVGFMDATFGHQGLRITGFLVPGDWRSVSFYIDDQLLKSVRVDNSSWLPTLRFDITNSVLKDFPVHASLRATANDRSLVTRGGAPALALVVPDGKGAIGGKLAAGQSLTKKGSWPTSGDALARRQEKYLRVYARTRGALQAQGRQLFLCYGTLLGCHREGRFIPGDDDFDVAYVSHAPDANSFRRECYQVARGLLKQGLDINFSPNGRLFKAGLDKVWIDITPMWFYRGRAYSYDAHSVGLDAIEPLRTTEFLGQEVLVPSRPEVLLADTYGLDWATPRSDFQYYRSAEDDKILSQMWAKPSEVREFTRLAITDRANVPEAGTFFGVGVPGYPGFSWLAAADGTGGTPPRA